MNALITKKAIEARVNADLVRAIIEVESGGQFLAVRFEPDWRYLLRPELYAQRLRITTATETKLQQFSWGLMQLMGSVARELGFTGYLTQLCEPETNLHYGCKKLAALLAKYPDPTDAIAAYNAGSPRMVNGKYDNQGYVDKVLAAWGRIKGIVPPKGA